MQHRLLATGLIAIILAAAPAAANAAFALTATGLADNALLAQDAGCTRDGGENRAPSFSWNGTPAGTLSFAIVGTDPDGGKGKGAVHVVLYNIPGSATSITSAQIAAHAFAAGPLAPDTAGYRGPCPPAGDAPHHYIITIYALDVAPALPAGLDRDGLMKALDGHSLEATTTILRYQNKQ
jgi:Raf kinase inhibitor-like YbhB/YbcL family protein